jgi:hypothetical protein
MNIAKAQWTTDGNTVRVTMPLQKVDKENRIVSGWATLDNVDTSKDIVLASASAAAFEGFRGNIRLMHQPVPAGKLVNFREDSYFDAKTQKFYEGIYVDVYVSKGAPQVWEMVLDGTLTGFSIGGSITDAENKFVKEVGGTVRVIKAYDLIELSLVDSPANQLCDVVSITKAADGTTSVAGMVTQVVAENVLWCASDKIAFTSQDEAKACNACGGTTENIGWFESDGGDKTEKVNALVAEFTKAESVEGRVNKMAEDVTLSEEVEAEVQDEPTELSVDGEGPDTDSGEPLGDDTEVEREVAEIEVDEAAADVVDGAVEKAVEADDEDDAVEKAASDDDAEDALDGGGDEDEEDESDDVKKMFADLAEEIRKAIADNSDATEAQLTKVNDRLAAFEAVANKIDELAAKQNELTEKFNSVTSKVESVEKTFDNVEKHVGIKKSGDLGGSKEDKVEKSTKSLWNGRFFGSVENI